MKVTAVKTFIVPPEVSVTPWCRGKTWVLIKLETDGGVDGWGEAYAFQDRENLTALAVRKLSRHIDGMDPFCIRHFMTVAYDDVMDTRDGIEFSSAAAGIEIALWDIVGKALGSPVHRLLGGPCRHRIGVYANCWSHEARSPDQIASYAAEHVARGFRAVKIYPFLYVDAVEDGIGRLRAVRDALGPDISIFVDIWERMHPPDLPLIVDALQANAVTWFEDPVSPNDPDSLARIRAVSGLEVVSGETFYSKQQFLGLLENKAADILNPDITCCGILGTKEIAVIAEAYSAKVAVHNNNTTTIGLAASMQTAALIPNLALVEYFPRFEAGSNSFSSYPSNIDEDGCIALPDEAGLGVVVDEVALAGMEFEPVPDGHRE